MELQQIQNRIFTIRGLRVMMDFHLAELYDVETKALNQAVKRNSTRFPADFMLQLTQEEWAVMRSQIVTASDKRNARHLPYAFTEQGVAMLSSVLKSEKAINMNIAIMRTFVATRMYRSDYEALSARISAIEMEMNRKFIDVHEALEYLVNRETPREIGFKQSSRN